MGQSTGPQIRMGSGGMTVLTTAEVAGLLRCSPATVLRWHDRRQLPGGFRLPGGQLRFREAELLTWIEREDTMSSPVLREAM